MENWEIAELPGACPTSYQVLTSEAGVYFSFICCGCLLFGAFCMAWGAWKTAYKPHGKNLIIGASLLLLLSVGISISEWQKLVKADDIRDNAGAVPGRIIRVRKKLKGNKGKEAYFYGVYIYAFDGKIMKGEAQLPDPDPGFLQRSELSEYSAYYIGRSYTVLFSKKHPSNSVMDVNCLQSTHR